MENKMNCGKSKQLKIAYIGGGSRGWAWGLMADLADARDLSGEVFLYDIDKEAACNNVIIGNKSGGNFRYRAAETLQEAFIHADFVIISILPGTFDEMETDVHAPEKYGIYQSVGDTTGPGGLMRALRTIPMYIEIAEAIRDVCPEAWVISYTNPMALCVATLYRVFPQIKAFGCCHEVFGTQKILCNMINESGLAESVTRQNIDTVPIGINHFTWITQARYKNIDLFPYYKKYIENHPTGCECEEEVACLKYKELVKFDLFNRFGYIASAGDRHLAEFCPGDWYLKDPETVKRWGFGLTPVSWRKEQLATRLETSKRMLQPENPFECKTTDEEGVRLIKAILGMENIVTNVNMPNRGQIANIPKGTVVETNALFSGDSVMPVFSGAVPENVMSVMGTAVHNQNVILNAAFLKDSDLAFAAFSSDRLGGRISLADAKRLFNEMMENTREYLQGWKTLIL